MSTAAESRDINLSDSVGASWPTITPEQLLPIMSVYTPAFLLGLHGIQAVLLTLQLPSFIQTVPNEKSSVQVDRQYTLPRGVTVDDIRQLTPLKPDLKPEKLHKRLGSNFNPFWMSVDLPDDFLNPHVKHRRNNVLVEDLSTVNITTLENAIVSSLDNDTSREITKDILDLVKSFLLQKASCPVYYIWEDLGLLYWPRFVRKGMCSLRDTPLLKVPLKFASQTRHVSYCSWPPGMHCVPGKTKHLKVLRWQCRYKKSFSTFNSLPLPGMTTARKLSKRSKLNKYTNKSSKRNSKNKYLNKQGQLLSHEKLSVLSMNSNLLTLNSKQEREGRDFSRDLSKRKNNTLLRNNKTVPERNQKFLHKNTLSVNQKFLNKNTLSVNQKFLHTNTLSENQKIFTGSANISQETHPRDRRETYSLVGVSWKQRRSDISLKCKWIQIPYPVTKDCFCSC